MADPERRAENVVTFRPKEPTPKIVEASRPDPDEDRRRVRANVFALLFAAVLVSIGWLLVEKLGHESRLQDCLMSGRSNCAPLVAPRP